MPAHRPAPWYFAVFSRFLVLACCCVASLSALAEADSQDYHFRMWTTDDGLPHSSVRGLVQDQTGFLWFSTVGGLVRFDGREFSEVQPPEIHRAVGSNIRGLAEYEGTLFVIPTDGNVLCLKGSEWSVHPVSAELTRHKVDAMDVRVDKSGNVWILGANRIVRWSKDGTVQLYGSSEGITTRVRQFSMAFDGDGNTWICADRLHVIDKAGNLTEPDLRAREPQFVASGRNGRIWVAAESSLLRVESGIVIQEVAGPNMERFGVVRSICEDRRGTIWIATSRSGFLSITDQRTIRVSENTSVLSMMEDREGNLWIATDGDGIGQMREKPYRLIDNRRGLTHNIVSSLSEGPAGRVWLGNRIGGLVSVDADGNTAVLKSDTQVYTNSVCTDSNNAVWFGGGRDGLFRVAPHEQDNLPTLVSPITNLHLLFRAANNDMWFAADPGVLGYFRGDVLHTFSEAEGYTSKAIRAMAQAPGGEIWLGDRFGALLKWDGERFKEFGPEQGFARQPVHALLVDSAGMLWVGTGRGLVLKDGDSFIQLTQEHGLFDDIILQVLEDNHGWMWFASPRGIFHVQRQSLVDVARGRVSRVQSHRLGRADGLVGISPIANYGPAAFKASDGRLWFGTAQGALAIDPSRIRRDLPPPAVVIDEVRLDGRVLPTTAPVRIPSGQHRIEFAIAALSFTAPEGVALRHKLEGADPKWVETSIDREASYANLAPGKYRFNVIAMNSAGLWNMDGASIGFEVVPAWWQTPAFGAGTVLLLIGLSAWTARTVVQRRLKLRLKRLEQERALERERQRIARDLHDDLGASLTEIGLLADRLSSEAKADGRQLAGLAWLTRRVSAELSGIVWTISPRNATLDRLVLFLRQYSHRIFRGLPITCTVKSSDGFPAIPLSPDFQHQLVASTREALNNVLKHSKATEVFVEMTHSDDVFEISIRDNGCGFCVPAAVDADGNGLRNIRTRIAEIGGAAEISSAAGQGTQVRIRARLTTPAPEPTS